MFCQLMPQTKLLRESSHKQAAQVPLLAIFRPDTPDHGKGKKLKLLEIVQNNKKIEKKIVWNLNLSFTHFGHKKNKLILINGI